MKKSRLRNVLALAFSAFLVLALVETLTTSPEKNQANATETANLEVPLTGSPAVQRTSQTYETLCEIAFLALVGTGFYIINSRR
jgi:hypothetical protein